MRTPLLAVATLFISSAAHAGGARSARVETYATASKAFRSSLVDRDVGGTYWSTDHTNLSNDARRERLGSGASRSSMVGSGVFDGTDIRGTLVERASGDGMERLRNDGRFDSEQKTVVRSGNHESLTSTQHTNGGYGVKVSRRDARSVQLAPAQAGELAARVPEVLDMPSAARRGLFANEPVVLVRSVDREPGKRNVTHSVKVGWRDEAISPELYKKLKSAFGF